jgi:hypothetical protein
MDHPAADRVTWSVERGGTVLHWPVEFARLPHQIELVRETAGPHPDGIDNFLHRFANVLATGFERAAENGSLTGMARDVLLAVALRKHPSWFAPGIPVPTLQFSIDPGIPLEIVALQPGSIAIQRVDT